MSWFSRSVSFLQGKDEPHEESDELGTAESEEEEEQHEIQVKANVSSGKGVKKDLSELTKSFTRQLWGVASFLAPPPSSKSEDPSSEDELSPQSNEQKFSRPESEAVAMTDDKLLKSKLDVQSKNQPMSDILSEANFDFSQRGTVLLDSSNPVKQSSMEPRITGIRSDLAELKGGFAKGLSHISSVIRVVAGEDLLVSSPSKASITRREDIKEEFSAPWHSTQPVNSPSSTSGKSKIAFPSKLASHIDGFSKLASSLLLNSDSDKEDPEENLQAAGVDDRVAAFADSIAMHPETWLDFPLFSGEEDADDFEMNHLQQRHVQAIEYTSRRLAALKIELCPHYMREEHFWKIYFALLQECLKKENSVLLSSPQVLEVRNLLLQELQRRERKTTDVTHVSEEKVEDRAQNDDASYSAVQVQFSLNWKDPCGEMPVQKEDLSKVTPLQKVKQGSIENKSASLTEVQDGCSSKDHDARSCLELPVKKEDLSQVATLKESSSVLRGTDLHEEDSIMRMGPKSDSVHKSSYPLKMRAPTTKVSSLSAVKISSVADEDEAEADEWLDEEHSSPDVALGAMSAVGAHADEDISFSDLEDEDDKSTSTMIKDTTVPKSEKAESNEWLTVDEEDLASTGSS